MKKTQILASITLGALFLACANQQAMKKATSQKLPGFRLLKQIKIEEGIGQSIQTTTLSNNALEKLGGKPNSCSYHNNILLLSTEHQYSVVRQQEANFQHSTGTTFEDVKTGKAKGGKLKIFNIKSTEQLCEVDSTMFANSFFDFLDTDSPYQFTIELIETEQNTPLLIFNFDHLLASKNTCQYNPLTKELKKVKAKNVTYKNYCSIINTINNPFGLPAKDIDHDDYLATINNNNLCIKHSKGKDVTINLKQGEQTDNLRNHLIKITASPTKGSRYIFINNLSIFNNPNQRYGVLIENEIILYDIHTGKPATNGQGETITFDFIPNITAKEFIAPIFGENDDFLLLRFKKEMYLYDLKKHKPVAAYSHDDDIRVLLTQDEKEIIITIGNIINICENPLKIDNEKEDLIERVQYLRKDCSRAMGEKDPILIKVNGIIMPVDRSFIY